MTDLTITAIGDAWVNSVKAGLNYGSAAWVSVKSGERRGFVLPPLANIAGRTVLVATLVGRVGPGHVAQTYTVAAATERWAPGRITWSNQPAINTAAQVSQAVSALADGGLVEVDVTAIVQAVADGTDWYGLRITTNSTSTGQKFYATDSGEPAWELLVTLSDAPEQPSDLRPDGGGAVSTATPTLAWSFADFGDTSAQAKSRVQVDTPASGLDPDPVAPDYDSTMIDNTDPEWSLFGRHTLVGAGSHYWRVQVADVDGNPSDWSDWAEFTVTALPTLVVDSPTGTFGDPTPTVTAHLSTGTVKAWEVEVAGPNRADVRAWSGLQKGAIDWTVPLKDKDGRRVLREDEAGWIRLRVWDSTDRAVAVGEKAFVETWILAAYDDDLGVTTPTDLYVAQIADGDPRLRWTWARTEAATSWLIAVDGVTVDELDPDEVTASGGTYSWTDPGYVSPLRPHALSVRAKDAGGTSRPVSVTHSHPVTGVWLLPDDAAPIRLAGTVVDGFGRSDAVAGYTTLDGRQVDVLYGRGQLTGEFAGTIDSREDVWAALDVIDTLRSSRLRTARLVWGSQTARVRLRSPDATSAPEIMPNTLTHAVRFGFVAVGD